MRKIHRLDQGSPEWHAHRNTPGLINGSEIAAIMGLSSYTTRADLVRQKATGITPDVDAAKQARFDRGHLYEALFRPVAESIIDDDLSAMVMSDEIDGVLLSVSLDGITQGYDTTHEHKTLNADLAAALEAGEIPEQYHPQMEAGLMVSGATRSLFAASKWEPAPGDEVEPGRVYQLVQDENGEMTRWALVDSRHAWYESRPELRPKIIAACRQFIEDVKNYVHVEPAPKPVAAPQIALPAVSVQVQGSIAIIDNLAAFGDALDSYVARINRKPETDDDFATLEATVKTLKNAEEALDAAENSALGQAASIDAMRRTVALYRNMARETRLAVDKLVKAEKENRKAAIITAARQAIEDHVAKLNARIGGNWMPQASAAPFVDAIKGLKSLDSMRDKVSGALANEKIRMSAIADTIEANRKLLEGGAHDWMFLFPDFGAVCTKAIEDFAALLFQRQQQDEQRKERERAIEARKQETAALEAAANNQRGKTEDATHAQPQATAAPQAPAASTPPNQPASPLQRTLGAYVADVIVSEGVIDDFLRLLPISAVEKNALRQNIVKWEKYRVARAVTAAADQDMEVAA